MCCNGALHGHTLIDPPERDSIIQLGLVVEPVGEGSGFPQPCSLFQNNCCSIYAWRPQTCQKYQCALLDRYLADQATLEEALNLVRQAQKMLAAVHESLPEGVSLEDLRAVLKETGGQAVPFFMPDQAAPELAQAVLNFVMFSWHLERYFRKPPQTQR